MFYTGSPLPPKLQYIPVQSFAPVSLIIPNANCKIMTTFFVTGEICYIWNMENVMCVIGHLDIYANMLYDMMLCYDIYVIMAREIKKMSKSVVWNVFTLQYSHSNDRSAEIKN